MNQMTISKSGSSIDVTSELEYGIIKKDLFLPFFDSAAPCQSIYRYLIIYQIESITSIHGVKGALNNAVSSIIYCVDASLKYKSFCSSNPSATCCIPEPNIFAVMADLNSVRF